MFINMKQSSDIAIKHSLAWCDKIAKFWKGTIASPGKKGVVAP